MSSSIEEIAAVMASRQYSASAQEYIDCAYRIVRGESATSFSERPPSKGGWGALGRMMNEAIAMKRAAGVDAGTIPDPRDAELTRLRADVATLRGAVERLISDAGNGDVRGDYEVIMHDAKDIDAARVALKTTEPKP